MRFRAETNHEPRSGRQSAHYLPQRSHSRLPSTATVQRRESQTFWRVQSFQPSSFPVSHPAFRSTATGLPLQSAQNCTAKKSVKKVQKRSSFLSSINHLRQPSSLRSFVVQIPGSLFLAPCASRLPARAKNRCKKVPKGTKKCHPLRSHELSIRD
jgi:hypothetical protein